MPKIYKSADELIGRTPLLELTNIEKTLDLPVLVALPNHEKNNRN